jgi:hypothetical protein
MTHLAALIILAAGDVPAEPAMLAAYAAPAFVL